MTQSDANWEPIQSVAIEAGMRLMLDEARSFSSNITDTIKSIGSKILGKYAASLNRYLEETSESLKYSQIPFFGDEKCYLYSFYVPLDVTFQSQNYTNPALCDLLETNRCILVQGTGGSGKSTFMKHLFLSAVAKQSHIPIYIELRYFNEFEGNLLEFIAHSILGSKSNASVSYISGLFESDKKIAVLLDAYDEVISEKAAIAAKQIESLASKFDKVGWVVTTRPMQSEILGKLFASGNADALSKSKTEQLVLLLDIDSKLKERFVNELDTLYPKHRYFLSTPLLLLVFLITYRDFASIPDSLHQFFEHAFYTLFNKHDALKDGYRRELITELDGSKFHFATAGFCALTYSKTKLEFTPLELESLLNDSKHLSRVHFVAKSMHEDLVTAVCILIREGQDYRFTHRLFQEYFTAVYLDKAIIQNRDELVRKLVYKSIGTDQVINMLNGINPQLLERSVIIPFLLSLKTETKWRGSLNKTVYSRFMNRLFSEIEIKSVQFDEDHKQELSAYFKHKSRSRKSKESDLARHIADVYGYKPNFSQRARQRSHTRGIAVLKNHGIDTSNIASSIASERRWEKHRARSSETDLLIINTNSLKSNPDVFEWLAESEAYWGGRYYEFLMNTLDILQEKHAQTTAFAFEQMLEI